jgi:hypothetical protein
LKNEGLIDANSGTLSIQHNGFLGAILRPKAGQRNGDSILMDFSSGFFAVSDSSDRNPSFSRDFLMRFADMIAELPNVRIDRTLSEKECRELLTRIKQQSDEVLHDVLSSKSCTLTGMLILKTEQGLQGLIIHTGDSLLFLYDGSSIRLVSKTNFWMVGRTTKLFQIEYIPLSMESRMLFSTDGLFGLKTPVSKTKEHLIGRLLKNHPAFSVPELLIDRYDLKNDLWDDLALISLCPSRFVRENERIIWGGNAG